MRWSLASSYSMTPCKPFPESGKTFWWSLLTNYLKPISGSLSRKNCNWQLFVLRRPHVFESFQSAASHTSCTAPASEYLAEARRESLFLNGILLLKVRKPLHRKFPSVPQSFTYYWASFTLADNSNKYVKCCFYRSLCVPPERNTRYTLRWRGKVSSESCESEMQTSRNPDGAKDVVFLCCYHVIKRSSIYKRQKQNS